MTETRALALPNGHIVHALALEHAALLEVAEDLVRVAARAHRATDPWSVIEDIRRLVRRLATAEALYDREERVVFSRLELRGILDAPHSLRLDHDAIRLEVKALQELAAGPGDPRAFRRELRRIRNALVPLLRDHIRREDRKVLPLALEVIGEDSWRMMKLEYDAIAAGEAPEASA